MCFNYFKHENVLSVTFFIYVASSYYTTDKFIKHKMLQFFLSELFNISFIWVESKFKPNRF